MYFLVLDKKQEMTLDFGCLLVSYDVFVAE
jgi:hypothetical protein